MVQQDRYVMQVNIVHKVQLLCKIDLQVHMSQDKVLLLQHARIVQKVIIVLLEVLSQLYAQY